MDKIITMRINGRPVRARSGQTVLEAARAVGIDIPSLCHHPAVTPLGACRICLVEIERQRNLQPACTFPVMEGLRIETESPQVVTERKFILQMLFSEGNHYCMFCERSGDCELQTLAYRYGLDHWTYANPYQPKPVDGTRKYFFLDRNRCILCRRCVRACAELAANHTLGVKFRGAKSMISADIDDPFGASSCVSCGTCLQICPTGALVDKLSAYTGREDQVERTKSVCLFCSVGCGTEIITRAGGVLRVEGQWEEHNHGVLCELGRFAPFYEQRRRVQIPLIRRNGELVPVSWEEALEAVADKVRATPAERIGAWTTTRALNLTMSEFAAVFQVKIGTQVRVLEPTLAKLGLPVGGSLEDLLGADCILVIGGDPLTEHRVLGYHIKRACQQGAALILVSSNGNRLRSIARYDLVSGEVPQAVKMIQASVAPVIVYGPHTSLEQAELLGSLKRKARFIPLFPASNGYHAKVLGLRYGAGLEIKGHDVVYLMLGDTQTSEPLAREARRAKTLVVQATYYGPVVEAADVVFPALTWVEQEGSLYNLEGKKVTVRRAVPVPEGLIPENEVFTQLAALL
jgi:formate dehydrogenase major subunit